MKIPITISYTHYCNKRAINGPFCVVRHGKIVELIQVAYTIEGERTRKREVSPLFGAGKKLGCTKLTRVTDHERETVTVGSQTVEVVPAQEWL